MFSLIIILLTTFLLSFFLTALVRNYALKMKILDIPNQRSSHTIPTPRGGGISIVLSFFLAILSVFFLGFISQNQLLLYLIPGALTALIGFVDDHQQLSIKIRIIFHFFSALFATFIIDGLPSIELLNKNIDFHFFGYFISIIIIMWLLNLYNFMDGIDGLASIQAITFCIGLTTIFFLTQKTIPVVYILLICSTIGFLFWNFPPAKIFMGDAGSGFIGLTISIMILEASWVDSNFFWSGLILMGVFIIDATTTLLRRAIQKINISEAHRSHAYQNAAQHYNSHRKVTLSVLIINFFWLIPISIMVGIGIFNGLLSTIAAYIPLLILAFKFKAGIKN